MLSKIARWLTNKVIINEHDEQQRAVYEYGCELWLYTVISTLGLFFVGIFFGFGIEALTIIVVFYLCQSNGGGYHASTHMRCFLTMLAGLLLGLLFLNLSLPASFFLVLLLCSTITQIVFPLHLNPNKRYMLSQKDKLVKRSRFITTSITISFFIFGFLGQIEIANSICCAMFLSTISRMFAILFDNSQSGDNP